MNRYFAEIHAGPDSQLGTAPCRIEDSPEVAALRGAESYGELLALADALNFQLRCRESLAVYDRAVALEPENMTAYRRRAARHITTLQPEKAVADLLRCRTLGGDEADISYRLGIACYLAGNFAAAMREEARCFPLMNEEMGIAAMFWHTLSAWRAGEAPSLLRESYRPGMAVGHHTGYEAIMALAAGETTMDAMRRALASESSDLECSILAYGTARRLLLMGRQEEGEELLRGILPRDGFWISYAYLAAWNDVNK